jgi:hypothetical protein
MSRLGLLADSMPSIPLQSTLPGWLNLHHGWCCDSFRLCGFCNSGTEVDFLVRGNLARQSR